MSNNSTLPSLDGMRTGSLDDDQWLPEFHGTDFADTFVGDDDRGEWYFGYDGDDEIYGGDGIDHLYGGGGNDQIHGDGWSDIIYGDEGDDQLFGDDGMDYLHGDAGKDVLYGGRGMDTLYGGTEDDRLHGGRDGDTLYGDEGNDTLNGEIGYDKLYGGDGDDTLNGGADADLLFGGRGNDTYGIDAFDTITEDADGGIDTVLSAGAYTLGAHLENLTLTGTGNVNGTGNGMDNVLTGNDGDNTLDGGDGNDTLIGGLGADRLIGGNGNDTFYFSSGDTLVEAANGGIDTIVSETSFDMSGLVNFEHLVLRGTNSIDGTGNASNNAITGNLAANVLKGMDGNDALFGGGGKDELFGGNGNDRLSGGYDEDSLYGGAGDDKLDGGQGVDLLVGGDGADTFFFGVGYYRLGVFDTVAGRTVQQNADTVLDFKASEGDKIALSLSTFSALADAGFTAGQTLNADVFTKGAWAQDADDYFLFDAKTGELWYDANGNGTVSDYNQDGRTTYEWSGKRLVATIFDIHEKVDLAASDFILIA